MADFDRQVRQAASAFDLPELLQQPTQTLLGVSPAAASALAGIGVRTVFDLGASNLFASARALIATARAGAPANRFGLLPGDLLSDVTAAGTTLSDIPGLPLSALRMLSGAQAAALTSALDVSTLADLANWPPHLAAHRLLGEVAGGTDDPEELQAEELRPRFGQYPTERVYYSTLVMLQMLDAGAPLQELTSAVSLTPAVAHPGGLDRVALGAFLTFEQSWFAQGITLGQLLHSLSLAPGEVTRVAVIDWSRRTSAFTSENISESEQLDSATIHARSLSEVQQAVAQDFQAGGSSSSSSATSSSAASARSSSSGLLQSLFDSGSRSDTEQESSTSARAESSSWSLGNRSVLGTMTQNVNDRTEQHSSSVRNRRASAVREVAQSEHEQVSTRVVANYNHMHALNVQYYEVVQLYRVTAALHRADRCLFVPMQLLDFAAPGGLAVVERFRAALLGAALNPRIRALLADDTTAVEIAPTLRVRFAGTRPDLAGISGLQIAAPSAAFVSAVSSPPSATFSTTSTTAAPAPAPSDAPAPAAEPAVRLRVWDARSVAQVAQLVGRALVRPDSDSLHVPDDTELTAISFDGVTIKTVRLDALAGANSQTFTVPTESGLVDLPPGLRLAELDSLSASKAVDLPGAGTMTLHCVYLGRRFSLPAIPIQLTLGTALQKVVSFSTDQADRRKELLDHLQSQRQYYSEAVFRSLDSATLTLILGAFSWNGRPLIDQVEPRPIMVTGNYLVLRAPVDAGEGSGLKNADGQPIPWGTLLEQRGLDVGKPGDQRLIPVPTGGVFAEAVLGRSNSAEKLDITRFWHWQDSPIPILPTEIAPIATGTRGTAEDLKPGQLSAPVLNIVNPTNLPDPAGLGAALNALTNLNFRDQSGLAGTQDLVKAASAGTLTAATEAGKLASENLRTEAQKAVSMAQIAADIAKAAIAASVKGNAMDGTSRDGANQNQAKKIDQQRAAAKKAGSAAGGSGGGGDGGGSADSEGGGGADSSAGSSDDGGGGSGELPDAEAADPLAQQIAAFDASNGGAIGAAKALGNVVNLMKAGPGGGGGGGAATASTIFPQTPIDPLEHNNALNLALELSLDLNSAKNLPIAIVSIEPDGSRVVTGNNEDKMYFSGSLTKIAAMYAAFALRESVRRFIAGLSVPRDKVFDEVKRAFNKEIENKVPLISAAGIPEEMRVPTYHKIFELSTDGRRANFTDDFFAAMEAMIIQSDDILAGKCIQALGYSWINGALASAGFFDPASKRGIWLAGDYLEVGDHNAAALGLSAWPTVPLMTENDNEAKQNATCIDVARMFVLINDQQLVSPSADIRMQGLLSHTNPVVLQTYLDATIDDSQPFEVVLSKIGIGPLKSGGDTLSEAVLVTHKQSGRQFVVVFQNERGPEPILRQRITKIVSDTIKGFP